MPRKVTDSGVRKTGGPGGDVLERAGFHPDHGVAVQAVADELERIVVSRCATPAGIQLLDEGYPSKGFGIKAKSCDWGPFMGFAMENIEYAKFKGGALGSSYAKQLDFFNHARTDTGFTAADVNRKAGRADPGIGHSSMAAPNTLKLSKARLEYLRRVGVIRFREVGDGELITCESPFGPMMFLMRNLNTGSTATWGILHRNNFVATALDIRHIATGEWSLVRGMCNTAPGGSPVDPHRRCCTGDYDLWGVFPKRNSRVASTRSLAAHGMERQMQSFSAAGSGYQGNRIKDRIKQLQAATRNQAVDRTHHVYGSYKEDREKGNISALTLHTAREMNRRIRLQGPGYKGGDMFHHNDDLGNPFRSDVEEDLIAFIPGRDKPEFIQSTTLGAGAAGHEGWNAWVKRHEADYIIYDNVAIHRIRREPLVGARAR